MANFSMKKIIFLLMTTIIHLPTRAVDCAPYDSCMVSFYEVLPSPEKFENVIIGISGVIKMIGDEWVLFPNRDSAHYNLVEQSLLVDVANSEKREELKNGDFVYVYGGFTASYEGQLDGVRGSINKEVKIAKLK